MPMVNVTPWHADGALMLRDAAPWRSMSCEEEGPALIVMGRLVGPLNVKLPDTGQWEGSEEVIAPAVTPTSVTG